MMLPVAVLPVKLIFLTKGCSMIALVISGASLLWWKMTFRTPSGRPASLKMEPMAQKQRGDNSEPLRTQVLPAASAYDTARKPSM